MAHRDSRKEATTQAAMTPRCYRCETSTPHVTHDQGGQTGQTIVEWLIPKWIDGQWEYPA